MYYDVIQKQKLYCRVIDVRLLQNRINGSNFVVAKLGKYASGEFLRSVILHEATYSHIVSELQIKKYHSIERVAIRPQNNVYHILQWDDVDRGICAREHVDEVQRDKEGKPIKFNQIVVFANLDNLNCFTVNEVLDKEYIEVNSPFVQNYLDFNNQQYYFQLQERKREKEQEDYNQMMSDLYDAYKERRHSDTDMTEEERIMSALENGEGELCGF